MEHTIWNTQRATHNTPHMSWKTPSMEKNVQRCVANAATVIGVTGRHNVLEVVDLGTARILTVPLPFTGYASWKGDWSDDWGSMVQNVVVCIV